MISNMKNKITIINTTIKYSDDYDIMIDVTLNKIKQLTYNRRVQCSTNHLMNGYTFQVMYQTAGMLGDTITI